MAIQTITVHLNNPHESQRLILSEAKRFNVLCCGRRFGKSAMAVNLLSETALNGHPAGYFTPFYKFLEGTFSECASTLESVTKRKHENQFIELITGGRIEFWSLENELAGRSRKYKRTIIDEAAFVKNLNKSWFESIRATLTDLKGDGWFMSTPRGKNDFFVLWSNGVSGKENWASWQMSTYMNPFIDRGEIEDAKSGMPEDAFRQEYMAEFLENVANPFGSQYIQQCTFPLSTLSPVCYGIDLAKYQDWTVIVGLDKFGNCCYFDRFQNDWRTTTQRILGLPPAPIMMDSTGVGDPIVEDVSRVRQVEGFRFSQTGKQQLMEGLQKAMQERKITFPEGQITSELGNFEYEYTRTGVKYSAPAGLHDDCVCALAMAWRKYQTSATFGEISIM